MPKTKPSKNNKPPKSAMIRVPVPLISAFRELSRLHREGHTTAILQGLQALIAEIDSNSDVDKGDSQEAVKQLASRLEKLESSRLEDSDAISKLEQRLDASAQKVAQLESAYNQIVIYFNSTGSKKQSSSRYYQRSVEVKIDAYTPQNLAKRLGVDKGMLEHIRITAQTPEDFISWSRGRDPSGLGWRYNEEEGLYYPVR